MVPTSTQAERSFRKMAACLLHGRLFFFTVQTLIKIEIFRSRPLHRRSIHAEFKPLHRLNEVSKNWRSVSFTDAFVHCPDFGSKSKFHRSRPSPHNLKAGSGHGTGERNVHCDLTPGWGESYQTKDDAELTIDGKHVQSIEEAEDSLTIVLKDTKIADSGKYSCTITNSEGSDTTTSKLTVSEATASPEFTQKLKDKDVKEGSDAEFTVKFTGKPKPTAKWTFDSADLTIDNTHTELKVEEDGDSLTLIIHGATKEDAGKYSCTISNSLGSQTSSGKLSVSVAPQFVKTLEDIEAEEGASLRLNIKFEGQPEPKVVCPTENRLAVLNHKILEANSQVQNVKLGGHQTCLSINRLWHELCDLLRRLVGITAPGHHDCSIQE
ncbi:hypothetical protein TNCV_2064331 [Trichonephila clavipes]|nr:hypothetical protein TNCV_2064331 [Trichonephila clavipes]